VSAGRRQGSLALRVQRSYLGLNLVLRGRSRSGNTLEQRVVGLCVGRQLAGDRGLERATLTVELTFALRELEPAAGLVEARGRQIRGARGSLGDASLDGSTDGLGRGQVLAGNRAGRMRRKPADVRAA
jgi:hypothetical protein